MVAARDVIVMAVVLFAVGLGLFIIHFFTNTAVDSMLGVSQINSSQDTFDSLTSVKTDVTSRFDYLVFAFFIGFILLIIILGWIIGGNPIFMFVFFILVLSGVLISMLLANVWEDVSQSDGLVESLSSFPITNHILLNLPVYISIVGVLAIIVMFAKPK